MRAGRSCRVLSAFYKQHSQFPLWPAERKIILCEEMRNFLDIVETVIIYKAETLQSVSDFSCDADYL